MSRYSAKLEDGSEYDQNIEKAKGQIIKPLKVKIGSGRLVRGWDEALITMSVGETAKITVQPEWGFGKAGCGKSSLFYGKRDVPANAVLFIDCELISLD